MLHAHLSHRFPREPIRGLRLHDFDPISIYVRPTDLAIGFLRIAA